MPLLLAGVIVVIPRQRKAAKNPLHFKGGPALAVLSGLGLVTGVGLIGGLLEQPADQGIGGFENRRAHQYLQLGHRIAVQLPGLKAGRQLLDFLLLGQEDFRRTFFFFEPARFWRVSSTIKSAYCSVSCRYWA